MGLMDSLFRRKSSYKSNLGLVIVYDVVLYSVRGVYDAEKGVLQMAGKRIWNKQTAKSRMISVRLPLDEFEQVKTYCDYQGVSMTDFVRIALQLYLIGEQWSGKENEDNF